MVSNKCWNCHFFVPDDEETRVTGVCRAKAPKGPDFLSFNIANQFSMRLEVGRILAAGTMEGDAVLPLHIGGDGDNTPPSCPVTNATGLNANGILPFSTQFVGKVVAYNVFASRLNSGAATVGSAPVLKLQPVAVYGDSCLSGETLEIPIPAASVQIHDTATDLFIDERITAGNLNPLIAGCIGFRAVLDGTDENEIAQVRNLKISVDVASYFTVANTPPTSKAKWATITDSVTQNCGEFKPSTAVIPPLPEE